jgi:PPM family protein phosphatase
VARLRDRMLAPCPVAPPVVPDPAITPGAPPAVPGPPVDSTPLPTPAPEPGLNCRSVG